ncbi:hypothetical protein Micbo1qcDRAFT_173990 [Microdochium bolleyi]|uniref:Uncharacterized protein n=1 Tax=Microdochium bolleyi TaxID=196109 RepID=A0A136J6N4_9PEZI|nr:hypothetical protein Micbo1qcDRAFT_173990 [Microdochium bolleyi]
MSLRSSQLAELCENAPQSQIAGRSNRPARRLRTVPTRLERYRCVEPRAMQIASTQESPSNKRSDYILFREEMVPWASSTDPGSLVLITVLLTDSLVGNIEGLIPIPFGKKDLWATGSGLARAGTHSLQH